MDNCAPVFDIVSFFPKDFPSKSVNEPFIQKIMAAAFPGKEWVKGDPDKKEPDYFCDGVPFEFTIASDSKKKNSFVQKLFWKKYSSEDIERDVFNYILERVQDKASKEYSVSGVYLCVLCLLDLSKWVLDYYGSYTYDMFDYPRDQFFEELREEYIKTGIFKNIFIIFPDPCVTWWIYDVLTEARFRYALTDEEIKSGTMPFSIYKEMYEKLFPANEQRIELNAKGGKKE